MQNIKSVTIKASDSARTRSLKQAVIMMAFNGRKMEKLSARIERMTGLVKAKAERLKTARKERRLAECLEKLGLIK